MEQEKTSPSAADLDRTIRNHFGSLGSTPLGLCIDLATMRNHRLFSDLGYPNMKKYIEALSKEREYNQSRINRWLAIGMAYHIHRQDLEAIGFADHHKPSKLLLLSRALDIYPRREVFQNIINLSHKDFYFYAHGMVEKNEIAKEDQGSDLSRTLHFPNEKERSKKGTFIIDGIPGIRVNPSLEKETYDYLMRVNSLAARTLRKGGKMYYLALKDKEEYLRYSRAISRLIKRLRSSSASLSEITAE